MRCPKSKRIQAKIFMAYFIWSIAMVVLSTLLEGHGYLRILPLYPPALGYMAKLLFIIK